MRSSRIFTAEAIVLSRRSSGEADRVLTLFTRQYGKIRVVARGVRKVSSKRAPHVEIFNRIIVTIHKSQTQNTLSEVSPVATYEAIRRDLPRIASAYYLCELVSGLLAMEQEHADVFALLVEAFETLAKVNIDRVSVLRDRFAAALLRMLGFLEKGKKPPTASLEGYVEQLLERRLKTVRLATELSI